MLAEGSVLRAAGASWLPDDANAAQALHDGFAAAGVGDAAVGAKALPCR